MAIISISGRAGSGKDTIGKIIQWLSANELQNYDSNPEYYPTLEQFINGQNIYNVNWTKDYENSVIDDSPWQIKRWADAVKQICSIILNVPVEQFEDREFKESELGEEWWELRQYIVSNDTAQPWFHTKPYSKELFDKESKLNNPLEIFKPTVRWLLQNIGTEVGRNIHPNMWVNVLIHQYIRDSGWKYTIELTGEITKDGQNAKVVDGPKAYDNGYPQWIITDTRFPNELEAVKERNGICLRVERFDKNANIAVQQGEKLSTAIENLHPSETALDDYKEWDWVIQNDGSIEELVEKVKEFLNHFKLI